MRISAVINAARNPWRDLGEKSISAAKNGARSRRSLGGQKRAGTSTTKHTVHGEVGKTSTRSRRDHTAVFGAIAINDLKRFEMLSSRRLKKTFLRIQQGNEIWALS